jgi:hypothetical protein
MHIHPPSRQHQGPYNLDAEIAHVDGHIEFVSIASAEDHIVWVVEVDNVKGHVFILAL